MSSSLSSRRLVDWAKTREAANRPIETRNVVSLGHEHTSPSKARWLPAAPAVRDNRGVDYETARAEGEIESASRIVPLAPCGPLSNTRGLCEPASRHGNCGSSTENHTPVGSFKIRAGWSTFAISSVRGRASRAWSRRPRGNFGTSRCIRRSPRGNGSHCGTFPGETANPRTVHAPAGSDLVEHGGTSKKPGRKPCGAPGKRSALRSRPFTSVWSRVWPTYSVELFSPWGRRCGLRAHWIGIGNLRRWWRPGRRWD